MRQKKKVTKGGNAEKFIAINKKWALHMQAFKLSTFVIMIQQLYKMSEIKLRQKKQSCFCCKILSSFVSLV